MRRLRGRPSPARSRCRTPPRKRRISRGCGLETQRLRVYKRARVCARDGDADARPLTERDNWSTGRREPRALLQGVRSPTGAQRRQASLGEAPPRRDSDEGIGTVTRGSRKRLAALTLLLCAGAVALMLSIGSGPARRFHPARRFAQRVTGPGRDSDRFAAHALVGQLLAYGRRQRLMTGRGVPLLPPSEPVGVDRHPREDQGRGLQLGLAVLRLAVSLAGQGVYDFNGVRDVNQLLNIANDLGSTSSSAPVPTSAPNSTMRRHALDRERRSAALEQPVRGDLAGLPMPVLRR